MRADIPQLPVGGGGGGGRWAQLELTDALAALVFFMFSSIFFKFSAGSVNIAEYLPPLHLGKYSAIFTEL